MNHFEPTPPSTSHNPNSSETSRKSPRLLDLLLNLHLPPYPPIPKYLKFYPSCSHIPYLPSLHRHSGQPHHPQQGRLVEASEPQPVPGAHGVAAQAAGGASGGAAALRQRRVALLARLPRHRDAGDGAAPQLHIGEEKAEG